MMRPPRPDAETLAQRFDVEARAMADRSSAAMRRLRREYTRELAVAPAEYVIAVAHALAPLGYGWIGWELIRRHRKAFQTLDAAALESLGEGIESWDTVDAFARILAGPAWLHGLIEDRTVHAWARSPDLWWRRAALVCTVALNMRSQGGYGDVARTLAICEMLATDRERMVQQALSWALRELVVHNAAAVEAFVGTHEADLSARTKRELRHKLATGVKDPRRSSVAAS